ncbi:MAG: argininosuccinate synthase [Flavobacteriales bacterium]|nr:argininosuccinate synthase [Flavobacteriales bacterium]
MKTKLLLAFSGGLDTSYCAKYLSSSKNFDVYSAIVNTGGFSENELNQIEKKALLLGVKEHTILEETQNYYQQIIKYLIYGNVLKNNTYPLSVSSERIHQAIALAKYAKKIGATFIAHGSTGAGNDQVRFDLIFQLIAPELTIITPIRDQQLSREQEIQFLKENGVHLNWETAKYSINKGLWGTSIGGAETLSSHLPLPNSAYPSQLTTQVPIKIELNFTKGEITGIHGKKTNPVLAIKQLETIAKAFAIGRDIHVGDTIIGIKGRVGFEAAAATIIIKAHHQLEKHTLTKWQLHLKEQMANWYGMFIHDAQYFDASMRDIEAFLERTQEKVSGKVFIELHPYRFQVLGIESDHDLMNADFGTYGESHQKWTGDDVKGFTKILSNSMQVYQHVNHSL